MGRDIPGEWWALFRSSQLDRLMDEGIRNSPNLIAAKAALTEARDLLRAQIGESYLPSIGLDLNGQKTKTSIKNMAFFMMLLPSGYAFFGA